VSDDPGADLGEQNLTWSWIRCPGNETSALLQLRSGSGLASCGHTTSAREIGGRCVAGLVVCRGGSPAGRGVASRGVDR